MSATATAVELEKYLHMEIPLSALMRIEVAESTSGSITLTAPLSTNHNHLGTAFGGSIAALATLTGYCALWTALGNKDAHVVIRRSEIEYLRPVTGDLCATCKLPEGGIGHRFVQQFQKHGKARMNLIVTISENENECVHFKGEFVAIIKNLS